MRTRVPDHPPRRRSASPFADTVPAVASAVLFGVLALVWLLGQRWLPGGRWVVVHLFTLGVLTTLIAAFTRHFATTFTGQGVAAERRRPLVAAVVLDASVLALLVGRLTEGRAVLAFGTVGLIGAVGANLLGLRRARRAARTPRFVWIVRRYEDAHIAFLVGALAGTAVGIGAVRGGWFAGMRDAHVHLNVLGWAGLTVLATIVVFGPALLRAQLSPGADGRAAIALRAASAALLVAVTGVVVAGGGEGVTATIGRGVTVAALAVYGAAVLIVVVGVLQAAVTAKASPVRWSVAAVALWFPIGVAIDVVAVAAAERRAFEVVGVVLFVGVLTQLILAVLLYLVPQLRARGAASRDALLHRTGQGAALRTLVLNLGVLVVAVAIGADLALGADAAWFVRIGWVVVAFGVGAHLLPAVWPVGRPAAPSARPSS